MEEISLRELIEILIKRKNIIIYITLFAMLASGVVSFFILDPVYEASVLLMASSDNQQVSAPVGNGNVEKMLDNISQYPDMDIETYRQQIKRPGVMNKTIEDLNLQDEYTIETLADKIILETSKDTKLITIKMKSKDPEEAANIVNKVGENFISVATSKEKERITKTSEYVKSQLQIERDKYDEYLLEQKKILSEPRGAAEVELELEAKLEQITSFKTQLNELEVKKKSLEEAISMLSTIGSTNTTRVKANSTNSSNDNETSSYLNSMNIVSGDSGKLLKVELAEVEGMANSIRDKVKEMQTNIEELQIELQEKGYKESIVNQKVDIAKQTYEAFVKKYEELRVTESSKIGEASITIISKAHPSSRPIGPRKALNVAISLVLGGMIGVFLAFFIEYWETSEKEKFKNAVLDE
ncbi:Wzz/FepE/Etk N-terminal domain-containing protein [Tissierella sp. MB52-C2]|uniref:GumC family protein n=1 Tax=Tissierella sp. MB52-C2 TaxID=3070999 RepID=UPI00280B6998|nr:Wzz/FepE/Etk N-terminal domain-containing protein [Tissierella sp. MB52-C2]WMM24335.1 Wzz/FepE/Etk N-terminal domain-containing protein [Tissierella sp. MB52-C2]